MPASDNCKAFPAEQLGPFGSIETRRMLSGAGIIADGLMFAIIDDERLFFKVDPAAIGKVQSNGMRPFTFGTEKSDTVNSG